MVCLILTCFFSFCGNIASIGIDIRIKNCFVYSWELIGAILALMQLDNGELGITIFGTSLFCFVCGICLGVCLCACLIGDCVTLLCRHLSSFHLSVVSGPCFWEALWLRNGRDLRRYSAM